MKYKIDQPKELTVRLQIHRTLYNEWETLTEEEVAEVTAYVEHHELGRRIAYDMWRLKNKQAMTVFMLHYG